jgi:hypothetical protein
MIDSVHLAMDEPSFVILPLRLTSALSLLVRTMPKKLARWSSDEKEESREKSQPVTIQSHHETHHHF